MNDRDEIRAGRQALQNAIRAHQPPLEKWQMDQLSRVGVNKVGNPHDLFLLCAAIEGDLLTLWRSYGGISEAEYAVDFDPSVQLFPIQQNDADAHPEPIPPGWGDDAIEFNDEGVPFRAYDPDGPYSFGGVWGKVEYLEPTSTAAEAELAEILRHLKKPTHNGRVMPFYLDYLAGPDPTTSFKHPGFKDEQEVRATWTVGPWWRFVLYRAGRFGVTPYIEVGASSRPDGLEERESRNFIRPEHVDPLPIRSVRIGPTRAADAAKKSLRSLLDASGYGHVKIEISETPYR